MMFQSDKLQSWFFFFIRIRSGEDLRQCVPGQVLKDPRVDMNVILPPLGDGARRLDRQRLLPDLAVDGDLEERRKG